MKAPQSETLQFLPVRPWHQLEAGDVLEQLRSDQALGLDETEAAARLQTLGGNVLTPPKTRGPLLRFLLQFNQPLVYILLAAATITAALTEWLDTGVILGVVMINAIVGFIQEAKALQAIEALARSMTDRKSVV